MMKEEIRSYRDLRVYQKAFELQQEIFRVTKTFPRNEQYSLTDQIRRSSRSIGANLAEAWAKRRYPAHFTSKLTDADAEQLETNHWIQTAFECGYIEEGKTTELLKKLDEVAKMLGSMMVKANSFTS